MQLYMQTGYQVVSRQTGAKEVLKPDQQQSLMCVISVFARVGMIVRAPPCMCAFGAPACWHA